MSPQLEWAAETGLDPDDYSVWDNDQPSQRAKAHRWAFARADEYCPSDIRIVTNRNSGSVQLIRNGAVATLDVDKDGIPFATWYGSVRPEYRDRVAVGELDQAWFDHGVDWRTGSGPVDLDDRGDEKPDPYAETVDPWDGVPQRDEWGRIGCYAWAIERLIEEA